MTVFKHYVSAGESVCFATIALTLRPCATSNKAADTQYPDPSSGFSADTDGCELSAADYQSDLTDHRAKYRLISMMERVIDVVRSTYQEILKRDIRLTISKPRLRLYRYNKYKVWTESSGNVRRCFYRRLPADLAVKRSVPDTLMPRVPIQSLPLDANIHPHLVCMDLCPEFA